MHSHWKLAHCSSYFLSAIHQVQMASNRQIKRKIAEIEAELKAAAPKLTAWSSVDELSSSQVPRLEQLQMSSSEAEEAGVSSYTVAILAQAVSVRDC